MKHKKYESWILDEAPLTNPQQVDLNTHLEKCKSCQILQKNWTASRKLILQSIDQKPQLGFVKRWETTIVKKEQLAKLRRYRLTLFGLIMMASISSIIYMLVSGSFMELFANGITMISKLAVNLTDNLSSIGYWFRHLPTAVPIAVGFLLFGMINAFVLTGLFFLWNLKQRKFQTNEIPVE